MAFNQQQMVIVHGISMVVLGFNGMFMGIQPPSQANLQLANQQTGGC